jgi:hypothetical protein
MNSCSRWPSVCFYRFPTDAYASNANGSFRIPFSHLCDYLSRRRSVIPPDRLQEANIVFVYNGSNYAEKIRRIHPSAFIVLVKPHVETACPLITRHLRPQDLLKYVLNMIMHDMWHNPMPERASTDYKCSDCVIADTKQLSFYFNALNKPSAVLPLYEPLSYTSLCTNEKPKIRALSSSVNILFHGSRDNFIASLPYIEAVARSMPAYLRPCFHVVLNQYSNLPRRIATVPVNYYSYSPSMLIKMLSIASVGLAPTSFPPYPYASSRFLAPLVVPRLQKNIRIHAAKRSENAGRAFIFAQHGIPFITTPSYEAYEFFSSLDKYIFASEPLEWSHLAMKLLTNSDLYSDVSRQLLSISSEMLTDDSIFGAFMDSVDSHFFNRFKP